MFTVHCPRHGREVLLGPRSIEAIANEAGGPVVRWRCHCGARGTHAVRPTHRADARSTTPAA